MTTKVASRCCSLPSSLSPPPQRADSMTLSPPTTSGPDGMSDKVDVQQPQKQQRLSFGISQILQSDDHRRPSAARDREFISGNGDEAVSTMALIRSAFGSYVSAHGSVAAVPGLIVGGTAGSVGGLYGGTSGVIRVPAQRLSAAVCAAQQAPGAACRLSAMMFPWMRERKDGLACRYHRKPSLSTEIVQGLSSWGRGASIPLPRNDAKNITVNITRP